MADVDAGADAPAILGSLNTALLMRIEDAGINASAPPQQLWRDGWLLRFSPGKAKRARCINAVAPGRLALDDKLQWAADVLRPAGLPLICRITPFSCPGSLDSDLAERGFLAFDDTRVMVRTQPVSNQWPDSNALAPAGCTWTTLPPDAFAAAIGALRGSPLEQRLAHAERLRLSPVPYRGVALLDVDGNVLACGQVAQEAAVAGLYDVFTRPVARGQGLAGLLCSRLLAQAAEDGARIAYLQVENDNDPARAVYRRLGFSDAYSYRYRQAPDHAAG